MITNTGSKIFAWKFQLVELCRLNLGPCSMLETVAEDRRRKAGCKSQLAQRGDRGGACAHPEQFCDVTRREQSTGCAVLG